MPKLVIILNALLFAVLSLSSYSRAADKKPNFLWIVSEDNGPFLGCYGDKHAKTPNLDKLASEGILYTHAFSNAPVCAPARSTLITGMYASALGTLHMRSTYKVPATIKYYSQYFRDAGYFCTNHSKTDYNLTGAAGGWDKGPDWRGRQPDQPFFAVINSTTSHESSLHGPAHGVIDEFLKEPFDLPPHHPDTPEIRSNWVDYYRIITKMDAQMGAVLDKLQADGLADDTIVFYYSDHGGILPRSKRFLYDTGLRIPLIIRFGKNVQHLAPAKPGTKSGRIVSLIDFPPTVMSLAGIKIPEYMQGAAFLGEKAAPPREFAFGFRGRMDERYDLSYTVRDARYRYTRNYMPHRIYAQHLDYLWKMAATRSWEKEFLAGKCSPAQSAFWLPKPAEELYDSDTDPWHVNNLAESPAHREILERLRKANRDQLIQRRDAGFLPEPDMIARAAGDPIYTMTQDESRYPMQRIMDAAEVASRQDSESLPKLIEWMKDADPAVRYWAAVGCCVRGKNAASATEPLAALLKDSAACVRIAAAEALCILGKTGSGLPVIVSALDEKDTECLMALNALHALGKLAQPAATEIAAKNLEKRRGYVERANEALLTQLGQKPPKPLPEKNSK